MPPSRVSHVPRRPSRPLASLALAGALVLLPSLSLTGCSDSASADDGGSAAADRSGAAVVDATVAPWQHELLDAAFDMASAMPDYPHIKNKARAQEEVVLACYELDLPRKGVAFAEQIPNWRRGVGYADFANWCAERGFAAEAAEALAVAEQVAEDMLGQNEQAWRRDRIRTKVAAAYLHLGRPEDAAPMQAGLAASEAGATEQTRSQLVDEANFDDQIASLEALGATGSLDSLKFVFLSAITLHERFYDDPVRRERAVQLVRDVWGEAPAQIRLETLWAFIETACDHGDLADGLALVEEAQAIMAEVSWHPEDHAAFIARLAGLRFRAGDEEQARTDLDGAWALYERSEDKIIDMFRAETLVPIAEAFVAQGRRDEAQEVYLRAVDEAVVNPNSRPRVANLTSICCSLVLEDLEPTPALRTRLLEEQAALGAPW